LWQSCRYPALRGRSRWPENLVQGLRAAAWRGLLPLPWRAGRMGRAVRECRSFMGCEPVRYPSARFADLGPGWHNRKPTATARPAPTSASSRPPASTSSSLRPPPNPAPLTRPAAPAPRAAKPCPHLVTDSHGHGQGTRRREGAPAAPPVPGRGRPEAAAGRVRTFAVEEASVTPEHQASFPGRPPSGSVCPRVPKNAPGGTPSPRPGRGRRERGPAGHPSRYPRGTRSAGEGRRGRCGRVRREGEAGGAGVLHEDFVRRW